MARKSSEKERETKRQELLWEIRVCKAGIERTENKIAKTTRQRAVGFILRTFWSAIFCAIVPVLIFRFMDVALEERIPHIILIAIGLSALFQFRIQKEIDKGKGFTTYGGSDCLEVLSERLRIAKLCLSALEEEKALSEDEKKYLLTFADVQEKKCGNCVHMGKTIKETTTSYSDGSTSTTSSLDHYFCSKQNGMRVKKRNACDNFYPMRVAKAFERAEKVYEETVSFLREEDNKRANGFR